MALIDSLIVFLVGLLVGALGIHIGARAVTGESDFRGAIMTAFIGAIVWAVVGFFLGWVPLLGPGLTFLAWLTVIKSSYEVGWIDAAGIAFIAWISVLVILYLLALGEISAFEAVGVPGV